MNKRTKLDWNCHPLKRVRYFDGQLLSAADLAAEQDYFLEKHRRHNLLCHGVGVVQGLHVSVTPGNGGIIAVSPGFAIDPRGNEMQLCLGVSLAVGAVGSPIYVGIQFKEFGTDPVPVPSNPPQCSRIEEGADVFLAQVVDPPALALARLVRRGKTWRLDDQFRPWKSGCKNAIKD